MSEWGKFSTQRPKHIAKVEFRRKQYDHILSASRTIIYRCLQIIIIWCANIALQTTIARDVGSSICGCDATHEIINYICRVFYTSWRDILDSSCK